MTTAQKPRTLAALVALCLVGAVLAVGRLTTNDPDDRVLTFATAWGTGTAATGSAYMMWYVGHHTDHVLKGGGHWEKIVVARRGDHVVLTGTASNGDPLSCSITGHGVNVHGSNRCEVLSVP